jgi:hypothetical protein
VLAHAAGTARRRVIVCSGERSRGFAQACGFYSRGKHGADKIKAVRMNRGMQALCGCGQSGGAATPHAGPATTVHASVGIDRRGPPRLTRGQQQLVRNRSDGLGKGRLCKGSLCAGNLCTGMRHRRIGGNRAMKCRVMNVDMAVGLVGMGAGHSWRKLNGDQGDRRANKLPDISVRVHQLTISRRSPHWLAWRQRWLMCGAGFSSVSRRQAGNGSRAPINGGLGGHRVYSLAKLNTITVDIPFGTCRNGG